MKKRRHVGLVVGLITVAVLLIAPVAIVFGAFYVKDNREIETEEVDFKEYSSKMIINAMEDTGETGKLDFNVTQKQLNGLLSNFTEQKLPAQAKQYVDRFYLTMDEDYYHIVGNLHASFFSTTVDLKLKFETIKEAEKPEDWYLDFRIVDGTLGRVRGMNRVISFAANKFNLQDTVNDGLSSMNLHMNVDLNNLEVTYKYGDFFTDIKALAAGNLAIENGELYFQVIQEIVENGLMDFDFASKEIAHIYCNLEKFHEGIDENKSIEGVDIETKVAQNIETLRDNNAITNDDLIKTFHYLFHGYDYVSEDERNFIDTIDLSSLGEWDKTGYKGVAPQLHEGKKLEEVIQEQIPPQPMCTDPTDWVHFLDPENMKRVQAWAQLAAKIANNEEVLHLYEEDIDNYVRSTNAFLGYCHLLFDEAVDGFNLTYVAVDNFYIHLRKEEATLSLLISVNGYDLHISLTTKQVETDDSYKIRLEVSDLAIGDMVTNGDLGRSLLGTLKTAITGNETMHMNIEVADSGEILGFVEFDFNYAVNAELRAALTAANKKIAVSLAPRDPENEEGEYYFALHAANAS